MYQAVHRVPHPAQDPSTKKQESRHRRKWPVAALTALGLAAAGTLGASQGPRPAPGSTAGDVPVTKPLFALAGHLPAMALAGSIAPVQSSTEPWILFVTQ